MNDWSSKQRPDIVRFVPYTYRMGITLKHCELLTIVNQYNWIDCSSVGQRQRLENTQLALCAHFLHLSFDLPFDEFLPETVSLNFSIQVRFVGRNCDGGIQKRVLLVILGREHRLVSFHSRISHQSQRRRFFREMRQSFVQRRSDDRENRDYTEMA